MNKRLQYTKIKTSSGVSIIEVMVSVLVLAVGILGVGGLQVSALQNGTRSVMRTQATHLSYEILDKMRSNPTQYAAYVDAADDTTFTATDCISADCDAITMAQFDVYEWKCAVGQSDACDALPAGSFISTANALPEGQGTVTANGDKYTITVTWNEERDGSTNNTQSFSLDVSL